MSKIYPINIDVFPACLWVNFGSPEECAEALRKKKINELIVKDWLEDVNSRVCHGMFSYNKDANVALLWLPKVPETVREYGILVHEVEHAAFRILDVLGMKHTEDSDEAYAYLIGYLFSQIDGIAVTLRADKNKME